MRRLSLSITFILTALICAAAQQPKPALTRLLEAELGEFPAKAGVYVKHLGTSEEAGVLRDEPFNSYSVIKLGIMGAIYDLAEQKKLDLSERYEIRRADFRGGSGVFRRHSPGLNPTVRDLIVEMVITSDNTATDILLAKAGGLQRVNEWLTQKGYPQTKMVQSIFEFFRRPFELKDPKYKTLTPEQLLDLQNNSPLIETRDERIKRDEDRRNWLGIMTPRETGKMLEAIERGTLVSKQASADMKSIMLGQQAGTRRIPHFLRPGYTVAHKTGDGPPIIANDVGIVYARSGPIVISFFTTNNRDPLFAELEDRIGRVSRMIVDYFDGRIEDRR